MVFFCSSTQSLPLDRAVILNTLPSAAGSDTLLQTPDSSPVSLIQYRLLGGTLDLYFFSGPSPQSAVEQYGALIGLPTWQPLWGFGFHLCRWGYTTVNETRDQVVAMREAGIPLETMWNDIDLYHSFRDFTTDPVSFPIDEVKAFIEELVSCAAEKGARAVVLIFLSFLLGGKQPTLHPDCGCWHRSSNQRHRFRKLDSPVTVEVYYSNPRHAVRPVP